MAHGQYIIKTKSWMSRTEDDELNKKQCKVVLIYFVSYEI